MGIVVTIAIYFLLRDQLRYLYLGTTYLEMTKDGEAFARQYDKGSRLANMQTLFGKGPVWMWPWPWYVLPDKGGRRVRKNK